MKLFKYQEDIVNKQDCPQTALFMSMGTGKTITSLNIYKKFKTRKMLIICLISKMTDWQEDLKKECDLDSIILNKGSKKNVELLSNNDNAYIINFESAWRLGKYLLIWVDKDTTILIDESHKIKNPTSSIGKFCRLLADRTNHKIILTGTPQSQGYIDYYNQLYFLGILNYSFKEFKDMFCVYQDRMFNGFMIKTLVGYKNKNLIENIIKDNCVFYERKVDDDMIPSDIVQYFEKPKKYDKFKKDRIYEDVVADSMSKLFVTMRTICSGNIEKYEVDNQKIQWLNDMLECVNDRIVIFYNFNVERDRIIKLLDNKKIPYSEYNGREKSFDNFKNNDRSVILCQFKSASTGINDLVISNICVMYSLPTEYIDFVQSRKRIDRIGQTKKPLFYYLVCKNTVEEKIYNNLQQGKDFDNRMFDSYMRGEI